MVGTIIYILGVILGVKAVIEIFREPISGTGKLITTLVVLLLSWIGIAIYYVFMRGNLTKWFK
ncbi:MAG: hypothetical protein MJ000_00290 [Bacteroidales bacterium]|nr:hypothetical protein [Bacteroidales bacterium]